MSVIDRLRRKYKDLEDVLRILEEACNGYDYVLPGKKAKREVKTLEEALSLDLDEVYVKDLDVTFSRLRGEPIEDLIESIERSLGGREPIESIIEEVQKVVDFLHENPSVLRRLDPYILAELFRISKSIIERIREV